MYRREFLKYCGLSVPVFAMGVGCSGPAGRKEPTDSGPPSPRDNPELDPRGLAEAALRAAKRAGAAYADIRVCTYRERNVRVRDRRVTDLSDAVSSGFGVRALVEGAWGFASSPSLIEAEVVRIARLAVEIARASSRVKGYDLKLAPVPAYADSYKTPYEKDPFEVPVPKMVDLLLAVSEKVLAVPQIKLVNSFLSFDREEKFFASTEGSFITQEIVRSFPGFTAVAVGNDTSKSRSTFVPPLNIGYEHVERAGLLEGAEQVAREAVEHLTAAPCPEGRYDLVLAPSHLHLTIHESCAHPTELDRALGWEADFAGTTFATRDKLGKLQYGSRWVNVRADRTLPHGRSTVGYDDDGVKTTEWHLVKDGRFVGYQTTRDTAPFLGETRSNGCSYAASWKSTPFLRIPNVHLDPGPDPDLSPDDLVADVKKGILIQGRGSYSIDQQRYNFQFGGDAFWKIENGKVKERLKDVTYWSNTTDFWNSCDGIAGSRWWEPQGVTNDGKGQPSTPAQMTHGCSWARFRNVEVGRAR